MSLCAVSSPPCVCPSNALLICSICLTHLDYRGRAQGAGRCQPSPHPDSIALNLGTSAAKRRPPAGDKKAQGVFSTSPWRKEDLVPRRGRGGEEEGKRKEGACQEPVPSLGRAATGPGAESGERSQETSLTCYELAGWTQSLMRLTGGRA